MSPKTILFSSQSSDVNESRAEEAPKVPLVTVVILTHNRRAMLSRCIASILNSNFERLEVIVIDDASTDGSTRMVGEQFPTCRVIRHPEPVLTAVGINEGISMAGGELVLVVDDDNVVGSGTIQEIVSTFESDQSIGVVGPVCYYLSEPDRIMYAGARLSPFLRRVMFVFQNASSQSLPAHLVDVDMFPNCFAIRKSLALMAGLVNADLLPFFNDDASLQLAVKRRGYRVVLAPRASVWHDYPVGSGDRRTGTSPMRLYYLVRSKLFLERYYDQKVGRFCFSLGFPVYLLGYLRLILMGNSMWTKKAELFLVLVRAIRDGLFGIAGRTYVR